LKEHYDGAVKAAKGIYVDGKGKLVDNRPYLQNPWAQSSCMEWDPAGAEEHDPPTCERAKLYRQVQRVLVREEKGKPDQYVYLLHGLRSGLADARRETLTPQPKLLLYPESQH
jgi:hypothetical protein